MTRLVLAALAVFVAGCGPAPSGLSPADTSEAVDHAVRRGDTDRAVALLRASADAGDYHAYGRLADAYGRGYFTARDAVGAPERNVAFRTWPWQAALARRAYVRGRDRAARAGDPVALLDVATSYGDARQIVGGQLVASDLTPAQRDSAEAIYALLVDTDVPRLRLALLAKDLGRDDAYRQHVGEAVAAREPNACAFQIWFSDAAPRVSLRHTAGLAAYLDRVRACAPEAPPPAEAVQQMEALREQVVLGNPAAAVALDSLRQLGVFERHPRLAAAVGGA